MVVSLQSTGQIESIFQLCPHGFELELFIQQHQWGQDSKMTGFPVPSSIDAK
jgi:hypothetical protein